MRTVDYIVDSIYQAGARHVFMVSGGGMMFLSDALAQHPGVRVVCNHHEQASAMAAVSYAKYNNRLGAAFVTTGCGGTNAITGLLGAWQDSTPCIFVSGQSKRKETVRNSGLKLRQFGVQEADIIAIVESITKYAVMVNDPGQIAYHLEKALFLATSGRPGPVWLDIPLDVQGAEIDPSKLKHFDPAAEQSIPRVELQPETMTRIEKWLATASRPLIIAGQGVRLAHSIPAFRNWIEKLQLPVVATRLGIDLLPSDHPLFIGRIGTKGDRAGNLAVQNADLILVLGSRLSVSSTGHEYRAFAREARVVVVDIDPEEHRKNTVRIDLFIHADVRHFLARAAEMTAGDTTDWRARCLEWKTRYPVCLPQYTTGQSINMYCFADRLSCQMPDDAVVVSDAGSAFFVLSQGVRLRGHQRYITSAAQAEMGYTLPACIGVSFARDGGEVLGVTGDGSFQMNIQELQTVVHHRLPVKLFVLNNDGYLSIRATQTRFFNGRLIGTDKESGVSFPATDKIAAAYGIQYFLARTPDTLDEVLQRVLAFRGPAICEIICPRDQEVIPTSATTRKADGTLVSRPLEDMYPFLDRAEFQRNMIVPPLESSR